MHGDDHQAKEDSQVYLNEEDLYGDDSFNTVPFTEGLPLEPQNQASQPAGGVEQPLSEGNQVNAEVFDASKR